MYSIMTLLIEDNYFNCKLTLPAFCRKLAQDHQM